MPKILVTPRSLTATPHPAIEHLREDGYEIVYSTAGRQPDEAELVRLVADVCGWIAGVEPVSSTVIDAAHQLRVISRNGTGVDSLPTDLLAERGIVVRRADGANAAGVAELTLGLILSALRHIPFADAGIKAGRWPRRLGRELRGRTVGVVGCGAVGAEVARLVGILGAQVLGYDPFRPPIDPAIDFTWVELPALFGEADVVTLHCPPESGGKPLLGPPQLAAMRDGAILVNTARSSLVDEGALVEALDAGRIAGYATDVFAEEPPKSLVLARHERVIATSHIGGLTQESVDRATEMAVANLLETLAATGGSTGTRVEAVESGRPAR